MDFLRSPTGTSAAAAAAPSTRLYTDPNSEYRATPHAARPPDRCATPPIVYVPGAWRVARGARGGRAREWVAYLADRWLGGVTPLAALCGAVRT